MRKLDEITKTNMCKKDAAGFSLIETAIALVIMTVGIFAALSAISYSIFSIQESEKMTLAKENARSSLETIFSIRDLQLFNPDDANAPYNWDTLAVNTGSNNGIFVQGWTPIREDPGIDGISGTRDDACATQTNCVVGAYTNTSKESKDFERRIQITDISQNGNVRKKYVEVSIRYMVNRTQRTITEASILSNLPVE